MIKRREIFVFGSNTQGRHGKGAALTAKQKWGAIQGEAVGLQGNAYAIVTKDISKPKNLQHRSISLEIIAKQVRDLIIFANENFSWKFIVSAIGCGLAGFKPEEIAPMFEGCPKNMELPDEFIEVLQKNRKMIIAVTGHRPNKIGNEYNGEGPYTDYLVEEFDKIIDEWKPTKAISGMALGVDTIWAACTLSLGIPLIAAIPFEGQDCKWPLSSRETYWRILEDELVEKVYVSEPGYQAWKMHKRNEWMVDHADVLVAVWDEGEQGGTWACIQYARSKQIPIIYIDPRKAIQYERSEQEERDI